MKTVLVLLTIISFFVIYLIKILWGNIPEKFQYGSEIGDIVFNLCIGYITSFLFYVLVVWIPEYQTNKRIKKIIQEPLNSVLGLCRNTTDYVVSGVSFREKLDKNDFVSRCIDVKFDDDISNDVTGLYTDFKIYYDWFYHHMVEVNYNIDRIISLPVLLDSELLSILENFKHSRWHLLLNFDNRVNVDESRRFKRKLKHPDAIDYLYKYYENYFLLVEYMIKNNINIKHGFGKLEKKKYIV